MDILKCTMEKGSVKLKHMQFMVLTNQRETPKNGLSDVLQM